MWFMEIQHNARKPLLEKPQIMKIPCSTNKGKNTTFLLKPVS
jgi:hypothetical protein